MAETPARWLRRALGCLHGRSVQLPWRVFFEPGRATKAALQRYQRARLQMWKRGPAVPRSRSAPSKPRPS